MRSARALFDAHSEALSQIDPAYGGLNTDERHLLAQTELCLAFIVDHLPGESVKSVPALMMGYPGLLSEATGAAWRGALMNVRHLCSKFGSKSAWVDALVIYRSTQQELRCFEVTSDRVQLRLSTPDTLLRTIRDQLNRRVDWTERTLKVARPGEARCVISGGRTQVALQIPSISADEQEAPRHVLTGRDHNPKIEIGFDQLMAIAEEVDAREADDSWPHESLPPLHLVDRLKKLKPQDVDGFYKDGIFRLEGATHVVGMLSSGKSTLVMALLFALTLGSAPKRIAILVSDTMHGAALSARLRRHAIHATVLSSFYNRESHLHSIYWQRGLQPTGWSITALGDIAEGFETACPLDGSQDEPQVISGDLGGARPYPAFREKQCHRLYQTTPPEAGVDSDTPDDIGPRSSASSCPLWSKCPAQKQQRDAVDAQVLIMTPQAFVHMTPDKWTTNRHLTLPELVQHEYDLVIVDEVDSVQQTLDDAFAPRSPIMGEEQNVYAPTIGQSMSQALRERSGAQFRKPVNSKWQSNFFTFFSLVGTIYAILQNEQASLRPFYLNTPFTSGGILHELWRRTLVRESNTLRQGDLDDPEAASDFLDVVRVAGSISQYSKAASVTEEADEDFRDGASFENKKFADASDALRALAQNILSTDYYDNLIAEIEEELDGSLSAFNATRKNGRHRLTVRANALALLLATVTDLALAHYNWLVRTQPAVANDFKIDDGIMLGPSSGLIRNYRTLLPANPAGAAFGLFYDEPEDGQGAAKGGRLTLLSHLGVGRHLLTHLHDLLADEGQAGPHVLMLSGTSWAGGRAKATTENSPSRDCASPAFDVQVPVRGVLVQPQAELQAVRSSVFSLINLHDERGRQFGVSGQPQDQRRRNLSAIAVLMSKPIDGLNRFERDWRKRTSEWGADAIKDRHRALLVTNSYADAAIVAEALARSFETNGYKDWRVRCLVRDQADGGASANAARLLRSKPLPRSLIERFGQDAERTILVAPMQIVARGHNILNGHGKAAISSIYFLHRVHPRPDDLGPMIARLNRFAQDCFDNGLPADTKEETVGDRAAALRRRANHIVRYGLEAGRGGYRQLPEEFKAQFAWNMITPLWQTVGRGIRGGSPVFVGFVDQAFAPNSFEAGNQVDTPQSSVLVQCIEQLRRAIDPHGNPGASGVARLLYEPFYAALAATEGLSYE